jgi:hypothetical protein
MTYKFLLIHSPCQELAPLRSSQQPIQRHLNQFPTNTFCSSDRVARHGTYFNATAAANPATWVFLSLNQQCCLRTVTKLSLNFHLWLNHSTLRARWQERKDHYSCLHSCCPAKVNGKERPPASCLPYRHLPGPHPRAFSTEKMASVTLRIGSSLLDFRTAFASGIFTACLPCRPNQFIDLAHHGGDV